MPWKESVIMNERMKFVFRLEEGEKMTDLCREFGISRKTGYKFLNRFKEFGPESFYDQSRRPLRSPKRTPDELIKVILAFKHKHPTWGAKKLKFELDRLHPHILIPSQPTIHLILKKNGLVKSRKRRKKMKGWTSALRQSARPNDIWCADFKGQFLLGNKRYCYPLTISDHFSRYLVGCEGLEGTKHQGAQAVFKQIFHQYGLPKAILTDNGVPFATLGIGGFSKLSVWWLRLGIEIERIEPGCPQQNGRHERMHLTLKQETARPPKANFLQQQERFDQFRDEFNKHRPHEALNMKRPEELYQKSKNTYPKEIPAPNYPLHDLEKRVSPGGQVPLFGRNQSFYLGKAFEEQKVGLREVEPNRWLVSFMNVDLGYVDEKTGLFEPLE